VHEIDAYAVDLQPTVSSIRVARRAVGGWVRTVGAKSLAATATLLVSELATNAVLHVGEPYRFVAVWRPPLFQVNVVDAHKSFGYISKLINAHDPNVVGPIPTRFGPSLRDLPPIEHQASRRVRPPARVGMSWTRPGLGEPTRQIGPSASAS
jgi:hypothetical protein